MEDEMNIRKELVNLGELANMIQNRLNELDDIMKSRSDDDFTVHQTYNTNLEILEGLNRVKKDKNYGRYF